ncbi:type II secretion system ATPase GspE [Granulosicoccaceae sp. 1_MG-2023]|nr:type II secretion system ATPase GspE [Granulosicoccaceae sp. 1_MG-2023]
MAEEQTIDGAPAEAGEQSSVTLPYKYAREKGVVLYTDDNGALTLAHRPDAPVAALLEARRRAGRAPVVLELAGDDFSEFITRYYQETESGLSNMNDELSNVIDIVDEGMPEPEDLMESTDEAPVIRLLNMIISQAIRLNASDIHIEPFEKKLLVRYRIDGVMHKIYEPPAIVTPALISRIKVESRLNISETRKPQDGRMSVRLGGQPVDIRVSTLPAANGYERVVMRLLDKQKGRLDLNLLGMTEQNCSMIQEMLANPYGIILVTGPTGSGKTTTLYASLGRLNDSSRTILTVEDPVEYYIEGIGQTQVREDVGLTFAAGLRAIVRQDPDVIMVGEIRDKETADIAVQSSLTGHLVLSTLHTNTAIGAVTRLRDMGVEPFLLSSTLVGLIAQRLVRLLCPDCKTPRPATEAECRQMGRDPADPPIIYAAKGCSKCGHTGYQGRSGIYEVVPVDHTLSAMIHDNAAESALEAHARSHTPGILEDGIRKVLLGETTLEEVFRVAHTTA